MTVDIEMISQLMHGRVISVPPTETEHYVISSMSHVVLAKQAAGCLLKPSQGDLVLMSPPVEGTSYVLSVLETSREELCVETDRSLALKSHQGAIRMECKEDMTLMTPGSLLLASGQIMARSKIIRMLAETVESVATRILSRCRNSRRVIEEAEEVEAESISCTAKTQMTWRAQVARVLAKDLTKIDGDQIQLG